MRRQIVDTRFRSNWSSSKGSALPCAASCKLDRVARSTTTGPWRGSAVPCGDGRRRARRRDGTFYSNFVSCWTEPCEYGGQRFTPNRAPPPRSHFDRPRDQGCRLRRAGSLQGELGRGRSLQRLLALRATTFMYGNASGWWPLCVRRHSTLSPSTVLPLSGQPRGSRGFDSQSSIPGGASPSGISCRTASASTESRRRTPPAARPKVSVRRGRARDAYRAGTRAGLHTAESVFFQLHERFCWSR